jgi:hypothetical protein
MRMTSVTLRLALLTGSLPMLVSALELQRDTLKAWDEYIHHADALMQPRLDRKQPFLWSDEAADRGARLRNGEILIEPMTGRGTQSVENGLIHDWLGAVFIPNATLANLSAVVHDYDRYSQVYKPVVTDSKMLACSQTDQKFSMVWQRRILFISAAIRSQYEARDFPVDASRGYNILNTTQVQEIKSYGRRDESLLPPGQGNGYIWRLHSIARYEERDGGVYLELEAIALTRDIPASLRGLVNPVVNRLSINSLTTSLKQTREAVMTMASRPVSTAACGVPASTVTVARRSAGN